MPPNDLPDAPWASGGSKDFLPDAPWASTPQEKPQRGLLDKLFGMTGPRYQTFPERMVREAAGIPEKMIEGAKAAPPGTREATEAMVGPAAEAAMTFTPLGPEARIAKAAIPSVSRIPETRQAAVDVLKKEGVDVSAGQARGSQPLRTAESALGTAPFSGDVATQQFNRQMRQFTRAALKRVGEYAEAATPEVIDRAFERIGNQFDKLEANVLLPDPTLKAEIAKVNQDYINHTSPGTRVPYMQKVADQVASLSTAMGVPGKAYKAWRSEMNRIMRKTQNPEYKEALQGAISAIDGAMERTLAKTNPEQLGAWREARRQYRNMMVIEKALPAGEAGAEGLITPAKLRQAALAQDKRSFRRGKSEFTDLALAGEQLLTPVRTSKTSERANALAMPAEVAAAIAALVSGNLPLAGGATSALFGPGVLGRILMNPRVQEALKRPRPAMNRSGTIPQELLYRGGVLDLLKNLGGQNAVGSQ